MAVLRTSNPTFSRLPVPAQYRELQQVISDIYDKLAACQQAGYTGTATAAKDGGGTVTLNITNGVVVSVS